MGGSHSFHPRSSLIKGVSLDSLLISSLLVLLDFPDSNVPLPGCRVAVGEGDSSMVGVVKVSGRKGPVSSGGEVGIETEGRPS